MNGSAPAGPAASRRTPLEQRWLWQRSKDRLCLRKNERRQTHAYTAWGREGASGTAGLSHWATVPPSAADRGIALLVLASATSWWELC